MAIRSECATAGLHEPIVADRDLFVFRVSPHSKSVAAAHRPPPAPLSEGGLSGVVPAGEVGCDQPCLSPGISQIPTSGVAAAGTVWSGPWVSGPVQSSCPRPLKQGWLSWSGARRCG